MALDCGDDSRGVDARPLLLAIRLEIVFFGTRVHVYLCRRLAIDDLPNGQAQAEPPERVAACNGDVGGS